METQDSAAVEPVSRTPSQRRLERTMVLIEAGMVLVLLAVWLISPSIRASKSLWVLFFYSFPAEFLVAVVPHEPVLIYFGKFYAPLAVAVVAVAGTVITEYFNYAVFRFVADFRALQKYTKSSLIQRAIRFFNKAPFAALLIAGFTPFPFYPFRFLVVLARYPLFKYLLAVLISRGPRFYLYAWLGNHLRIPDVWILLIMVAALVIIYVPLIRVYLRRKRKTVETQE